jgi:predicted O-methyltransferase YrrM
MEHIYNNLNFGENWFDYAHVYDYFISQLPKNAKVVEVGCWKGKSVAYLAVEAINSGKEITIDAVDTWEGSPEHQQDAYVRNKTLYELFCENIKPISHIVTPIKKRSLDAVNLYANESLDLVFIDAAHDYNSVLQDIKAWLPKVKQGGIIAGHDYNDTWPGVKQAVQECFQDFLINPPCWIYKNKG